MIAFFILIALLTDGAKYLTGSSFFKDNND